MKWIEVESSPEDGQCDECGGDLYEVETSAYVNSVDGDAICYSCYMNPDPSEDYDDD